MQEHLAAIDVRREEKERIAVHVFLARYMRLSLEEIGRLTRSEIASYVRALGELFEREGGSRALEESIF